MGMTFLGQVVDPTTSFRIGKAQLGVTVLAMRPL